MKYFLENFLRKTMRRIVFYLIFAGALKNQNG